MSWYQTTSSGSKNSPGATAKPSSVSREIAKHHAAKSSRTAPSTVCGNTAAAGPDGRDSASRSGGHQPSSVSTSSFITTQ